MKYQGKSQPGSTLVLFKAEESSLNGANVCGNYNIIKTSEGSE